MFLNNHCGHLCVCMARFWTLDRLLSCHLASKTEMSPERNSMYRCVVSHRVKTKICDTVEHTKLMSDLKELQSPSPRPTHQNLTTSITEIYKSFLPSWLTERRHGVCFLCKAKSHKHTPEEETGRADIYMKTGPKAWQKVFRTVFLETRPAGLVICSLLCWESLSASGKIATICIQTGANNLKWDLSESIFILKSLYILRYGMFISCLLTCFHFCQQSMSLEYLWLLNDYLPRLTHHWNKLWSAADCRQKK